MKLVWHMVVKDARRLWPAVLLWAGLFTAHRMSEWRLAQAMPAGNVEVIGRLQFIEMLTFVVQLLTAYVFAATLVVEDSPVGTSTFWPTRPISGARLFAGKVLGCVLWFGVLALLLALPWWLAGDMVQSDLGLRAKALLCVHAWLIGTAFLVASFTGSVEKFLGWSLGYFLFVGAVGLSVGGPSLLANTFARWDPVAIMASRATRINAVGAIIALLIQYQTRRRFMALLGVAAFAALMVAWDAIF
jgi:ABC-type transport system involved in multi-copper enzyme maturation permease subunit